MLYISVWDQRVFNILRICFFLHLQENNTIGLQEREAFQYREIIEDSASLPMFLILMIQCCTLIHTFFCTCFFLHLQERHALWYFKNKIKHRQESADSLSAFDFALYFFLGSARGVAISVEFTYFLSCFSLHLQEIIAYSSVTGAHRDLGLVPVGSQGNFM